MVGPSQTLKCCATLSLYRLQRVASRMSDSILNVGMIGWLDQARLERSGNTTSVSPATGFVEWMVGRLDHWTKPDNEMFDNTSPMSPIYSRLHREWMTGYLDEWTKSDI